LKFLSFFLIFCLTLGLFSAFPARAAGPALSAPKAMLLDSSNGAVLYEKEADARLYPASTTKIMTILLAAEAVEKGIVSLNDKVTASESMLSDLIEDGSSAGIQPGETLTFEDLLYCALLASANEACNIIAEHVSGSVRSFLAAMNERAAALGCTQTHFSNTHGLPDEQHYTTARDFSRIALEACRHPLVARICATAQHVVPETNLTAARTLENSNPLLNVNSMYGSGYVYEGCTGLKTGHTSAAGYCLVSSAERGGSSLLCLIFGNETSDECFRDSADLLDWGFANGAAEGSVVAEDPTVSLTAGPDSFDMSIDSAAAAVLDRDSGEVFFLKNAGARCAPSDLTKLMTALLAAEAVEAGTCSLSSEVTVTANALAGLPAGALRRLSAGETLPLESLLYLILLTSADDACNVVAEYVGGSLYAFVRLMNARARQLGCADTSFSNAHGLPDDTQYSTAADLALIALEVSRNDLLARICATKAAELPETNLSPTRTVESTNPLINENSSYGSGYLFARANGLKTAYSEEAGFCLAASAADERCGIRLVGVVLGGTQTDAGVSCFTDTAALSSYVFDNYSYQEILPSKQNIASIDVLLGQDADYVNLHPASSIPSAPNDYDLQLQEGINHQPTKSATRRRRRSPPARCSAR
jgi:D-alanyl-D-alanine carboxypeptidase (penicillin-binding protein 5/6)